MWGGVVVVVVVEEKVCVWGGSAGSLPDSRLLMYGRANFIKAHEMEVC